jgi:ATP-dependent helicase YprA (DUF1998 family)
LHNAALLQAQAQVVGRFRSGELNLLVATNIGSEGMDFKQCAAVVAFEPPPDLTSYIQVLYRLLFHLSYCALHWHHVMRSQLPWRSYCVGN